MKYVILIPIYNDRESLKILVENINSEIKDLNHEISLVIVNDASSHQIIDNYSNTENISSFEIINMNSLGTILDFLEVGRKMKRFKRNEATGAHQNQEPRTICEPCP